MIEKISILLTGKLLEKKVILKEYYDIYKYGVEIVISSIIGFLLTMLIGAVLSMIKYALVYYVIFVALRTFTGGFHANTYLQCNLVFSVVTALVLSFSKISEVIQFSWYAIISLFCISITTFIWLAPIENPNKPIKKESRKVPKLLSIVISSFLFVSSLLLYINGQILYAAAIIYSVFAVAVLCLITIIPGKGGEISNE